MELPGTLGKILVLCGIFFALPGTLFMFDGMFWGLGGLFAGIYVTFDDPFGIFTAVTFILVGTEDCSNVLAGVFMLFEGKLQGDGETFFSVGFILSFSVSFCATTLVVMFLAWSWLDFGDFVAWVEFGLMIFFPIKPFWDGCRFFAFKIDLLKVKSRSFLVDGMLLGIFEAGGISSGKLLDGIELVSTLLLGISEALSTGLVCRFISGIWFPLSLLSVAVGVLFLSWDKWLIFGNTSSKELTFWAPTDEVILFETPSEFKVKPFILEIRL